MSIRIPGSPGIFLYQVFCVLIHVTVFRYWRDDTPGEKDKDELKRRKATERTFKQPAAFCDWGTIKI
jgi:hypothetical protein